MELFKKVHAFNPSAQEAEAGDLSELESGLHSKFKDSQGYIHRETMSFKNG